MMRRGRPVDDTYLPGHRLYYRIEHADEIEGNYLDPNKIRAAFDVSVNWSKYSWSCDVIFDAPASGIASLFVKDICVDLPWDQTPPDEYHVIKSHTYCPKHDPCDDNYSHTSIAAFKDGKRVTKSDQIAKIAKREFRQLLSDKAVIILRPS